MKTDPNSNPLTIVKTAAGETMQQLQDRVRRVISPSGVLFIYGRMCLTRKGFEDLAQAVVDGRIDGHVDQARLLLSQSCLKSLTNCVIARPKIVREWCEAILDGRANGNPDIARELLARLDRDYPGSL